MPGVNVPWSQVLYYFVTLSVSGIFHEVGHAIAAVRFVLGTTRPQIFKQNNYFRLDIASRTSCPK